MYRSSWCIRCASIQTLKKTGQRSPDPQRCQQWSLIKGMLISRERDMLVFRRVCIPPCWIKTGWFLVDDSVMRVLLWVDDNMQHGLGQHQAHWHESHLLGRCCLNSCSQRCSYDVSSDKIVGVRSSFYLLFVWANGGQRCLKKTI